MNSDYVVGGLILAFCLVIIMFVFMVSKDVTTNRITNTCDDFGKFKAHAVWYECKEIKE